MRRQMPENSGASEPCANPKGGSCPVPMPLALVKKESTVNCICTASHRVDPHLCASAYGSGYKDVKMKVKELMARQRLIVSWR